MREDEELFDLLVVLRRSSLRHIREAADELERLRRWRQYAIERLGVGPEVVAEIDVNAAHDTQVANLYKPPPR